MHFTLNIKHILLKAYDKASYWKHNLTCENVWGEFLTFDKQFIPIQLSMILLVITTGKRKNKHITLV